MKKLLMLTTALTLVAGVASANVDNQRWQQGQQGMRSTQQTQMYGQTYQPNPGIELETRAGLRPDSQAASTQVTAENVPLISGIGLNGNYGVMTDPTGAIRPHDRMSTHDRYSSGGASVSVDARATR